MTTNTNTIVGKLVKKVLIKGTITAKTGLHIGGSNAGMSIGSADATVVRNPITREPYIPGSSLKGKMRSLLEKLEGIVTPDTKNLAGKLFITDINNDIAKIFGVTPEDLKKSSNQGNAGNNQEKVDNEQPVCRLIVRDAPLTRESAEKLFKSKDTDMPYTEVKTEVVIDRITSAATPRQTERVPAGAMFEMSMILNVFDGDDDKTLLNKVFEGLVLVQNDYLGGKGTRGCGEVEIKITEIKMKDKTHYENNTPWQEYNAVIIPEELK